MGMIQIGTPSTSQTVAVSGAISTGFPTSTSSQTIINKAPGKAGTAITAGTGATLHTVTAQKSLYITSLFINVSSGAGIELRDNGSGGTVKFTAQCNGLNYPVQVTFPTPLKFSTDVWLDLGANATAYWSFSGFEQ